MKKMSNAIDVGQNVQCNINGIAQVFLNEEDVVRHRLVKEIIKRYNSDDVQEKERYEQRKLEKQQEQELKRNEIQNRLRDE